MAQHSNHSISTKMRRLDTHWGDSAESILNETGISKFSLYWSENTTFSFLEKKKKREKKKKSKFHCEVTQIVRTHPTNPEAQ